MSESATISGNTAASAAASNRKALGARIAHVLAVLVAASTLLLIVVGGTVTTTRSGDTEPSWSLKFWEWFRPWSELHGGHLFEMSHRQIGTVVGFMMMALVAVLWKTERRNWVRRLGYIAMGLVVLQGALGGLRVLVVSSPEVQATAVQMTGVAHAVTLRMVTAMVHGTVGPMIFAMMVAIAVATSSRWQQTLAVANTAAVASIRQLSVIALILLVVQLALGTFLRHVGWAQYAVVVHATGAFLVAYYTVVIAFKAGRVERDVQAVRGLALAMALIVQFQILLGVSSFAVANALVVRTVHQVMGSVLLATCLVLVLRVFNLLKPTETGS